MANRQGKKNTKAKAPIAKTSAAKTPVRKSPIAKPPIVKTPIAPSRSIETMTEPDDDQAFIKLDQFLKMVGVTGTGGQAKVMIQSGEVRVNGSIETRRGRKLRQDDVVELFGEAFNVELIGEEDAWK